MEQNSPERALLIRADSTKLLRSRSRSPASRYAKENNDHEGANDKNDEKLDEECLHPFIIGDPFIENCKLCGLYFPKVTKYPLKCCSQVQRPCV